MKNQKADLSAVSYLQLCKWRNNETEQNSGVIQDQQLGASSWRGPPSYIRVALHVLPPTSWLTICWWRFQYEEQANYFRLLWIVIHSARFRRLCETFVTLFWNVSNFGCLEMCSLIICIDAFHFFRPTSTSATGMLRSLTEKKTEFDRPSSK
jgi:hypothetical protein